MPKVISRFLDDTGGSAAVEYSLVIGALTMGVIAGILSLGQALSGIYQTIASGLVSIGGAGG
jgi:Flp pilus assembly pilin Flp